MLEIPAHIYQHKMLVAQRVNELADNVREKDQKKKFLMRAYPPTVEQLEEHSVREKLGQYYPYLLYYHEPELRPVLFEEEETVELLSYIDKLFKEELSLVEEPSDPFLLDGDTYDWIIEHYDESCEEKMKELSDFEKTTFTTQKGLTYERLLSIEPTKNLDRFMPFILGIAEPSLQAPVKPATKLDDIKIKEYIKRLTFESIEIV